MEGRKSLPSVTLLVTDTMRADMLSRPGLLARLPTIQRFFGESYVFSRAYAPSFWTLPTHASIFTGLAPSEHGAFPPRLFLRPTVPTLAETFRRAGYATACLTSNYFLDDAFGVTRGFDEVWHAPPPIYELPLDLPTPRSPGRGDAPNGHGPVRKVWSALSNLMTSSPLTDNGARATVRRTRTHLVAGRRPCFTVLNLMEAHPAYRGRGAYARWRKRLRHRAVFQGWSETTFAAVAGRLSLSPETLKAISEVYWENVRYMDRQIGRLFRSLPAALLEEGYVILVSDHGQLLGERNALDHLGGLDEGLIHVPLAVRPPGGIARRRIDTLVETTWLFHLLSAIARGEPRALEAWIRWTSEQGCVVSESQAGTVPFVKPLTIWPAQVRNDLLRFKARSDHPAAACLAGPWKLICNLGRKPDQLFDLSSDPSEVVNLTHQRPDLVESLHARLAERYARETSSALRSVRHERLPLPAKVAIAQVVLTAAMEDGRHAAILWTGGKDSTLVLHLADQAARAKGVPLPPAVFVDHGQHFPETWAFMEEAAKRYGVRTIVARNKRLFELAGTMDGTVPLERLDPRDQEEALKAGLEGDAVPLSLHTQVGNHLMKTVALNETLTENGFDTVITGIRWDENPARAEETFFSAREKPRHTRVHPILPWTEREVWDYTRGNGLPIHPLYHKGYRSLDGIHDSRPTDSRPAWEQDLDGTQERAGRAQDKEHIMERLRALGYF